MTSLVNRFKDLGMAYLIYRFAFGVFLVDIVLALAFPTSIGTQRAIMLLSAFGFAIGFAVWCWPFLTKAWTHPVGKVSITILHLFVLLLSTAFARSVVASSLGLPPQDFELTVSFIAIALYIPAWSIVVSFLIGVLAIVAMLIIGLLSVVARQLLAGLTTKVIAHMVGAIAISLFFAYIFVFVGENEKYLHPVVKWVAFISDFQATPNYPGIKDNERIRLHENGVISFAQVQDGEVKIVVRAFNEGKFD